MFPLPGRQLQAIFVYCDSGESSFDWVTMMETLTKTVSKEECLTVVVESVKYLSIGVFFFKSKSIVSERIYEELRHGVPWLA